MRHPVKNSSIVAVKLIKLMAMDNDENTLQAMDQAVTDLRIKLAELDDNLASDSKEIERSKASVESLERQENQVSIETARLNKKNNELVFQMNQTMRHQEIVNNLIQEKRKILQQLDSMATEEQIKKKDIQLRITKHFEEMRSSYLVNFNVELQTNLEKERLLKGSLRAAVQK